MAKLLSAYGYKGDAMNLPVADVETAAPYYVRHMGFTIARQDSGPGEPPSNHPITENHPAGETGTPPQTRRGAKTPPLLGQEGGQDRPVKRVILERDGIRIALAENGGDPEQDGCAFHTDDVTALRDEFIATGLDDIGKINEETRDGGKRFKVFFVVAPDGLCYWFGERQ